MGFLLLGVDSLIAGTAIGPAVDRRSRLPLAALFGVADAVGFLIAAGVGWQLSDDMSVALETGILVSLGLWLLVVAASMPRVAGSWPVWIVPLALTVDNLAYGLVGSTGSLFGHAAEQAASSALLALVGLSAAIVVPRVLPMMERRTAAYRFAGGALLLAAGALVLLG